MTPIEKIQQITKQIEPELIAQRRDFHKYAETGWLEMRTSSIIARKLTELGYEVLTGEDVCLVEARMGVPEEAVLKEAYERALAQGADPEFRPRTRGGMTGVIGILHCGEGPVMALRFDIDALGVTESDEAEHKPAALGFASVNPGVMHACGHDAHATIGLGVAQVLMNIREHLHGTVKLIFQPAEEGVRGALSIVKKGHLEGVQYFLASHVGALSAEDPADVIGGGYGALATCKYDVTYKGQAAHAGGAPNEGKNALLAAASAVMSLHAIPRHKAGASRINVGTLHAGSGRNVIPDEAKMELEVRGDTTQINDYMCQWAERIIRASADMYGCDVQLRVMGAAISLQSDEEMSKKVVSASKKVGLKPAKKLAIPSFGSEDCAYMMERVQQQGGLASFMWLTVPTAAPAHTRRFDASEKVLTNGVMAFCATVLEILG